MPKHPVGGKGFAWLFLGAYTCSGLAGLIYEVSWTRQLTLYMGHSTASTSAVVAAFMGGLAGGTALGGRMASRLTRRQSLAAYVALESIVVAAALILPWTTAAVTPVLRWAYGHDAPGGLFAIVRLTSCLALLLVPATALGATFPMAIRWFAGAHNRPGRTAGALYAANTVGAAVGALAAGLVLIPALGVARTTLTGVAASAIAMAGMLVVRARGSDDAGHIRTELAGETAEETVRPRKGRHREDASQGQAPTERAWLPAVVLGLSGFVGLMFEVVWTRLFSLVIGPTTYAFSVTVACVIAGVAGGAVLGSWAAGRVRRPAVWLAVALAGTALVTTAAASVAGRYGGLALRLVPGVVAPELVASGGAFTQVLAREIALAAALMLPTALGLGTIFPLALEMLRTDWAHLARQVGVVYAVNALAGLAGALAAGFVTIPLLGLQGSLRVVVGLLIAGGVVVLVAGRLSRLARAMGLVPVGAAAIALLASPPWDRALLASGAYKYAPYVAKTLDIAPALKAGRLLYYREGAAATVSVNELAGTRSLAIDGKIDASNTGDMLTQKALAHLPLLLHGQAREICIIGLGSGVTVASALQHPIARADVVELSPEVVDASRYFSEGRENPLDDPRTHLIVGDGRTHLLLSPRKYDVIISEPSNPWIAGVAALFTREFFLAARDRLAPGGIICQWAHTYDISARDLRSIVATFRSVFPDGTLWLIGQSDILLVASSGPIDGQLENLRRGWERPAVSADLRTVSAVEPFAFWSLFVGGPNELARYVGDAPLQTDDRMALEFSGPRAINNRGASGRNVEDLLALRAIEKAPSTIREAWRTAGAAQWRGRAAMMVTTRAYEPAYQDYVRALTIQPVDTDALDGFVGAAVALGRERQAVDFLKSTMGQGSGAAPTWIAMSKLLAAGGALDAAVDAARQASAIAPARIDVWEQMASLVVDGGQAGPLDPIVEQMQRLFPDAASTHYYAAAAKSLHGQLAEALTSAQRAIAANPDLAAAHDLLGLIHARRGEQEQARRAYLDAVHLNPRGSGFYVNLGMLELDAGRPVVAKGYFVEALLLDPASQRAQQGLEQAERADAR